MSAGSDAEAPDDHHWRRSPRLVAFLTFAGIVLLLLATDNTSRTVTLGLPAVAAVLGLVVSRLRPDSPLGPGLLRGAGLVAVLYAAGAVLLLLSLAG